MKGFLVSLAVLLFITGVTLADDCGAPVKFKITTEKKDDTVLVQADNDKSVFIVKSPSGISQAGIERVEEKWPDAVVLRLHLKGLEHFRASNAKVTLAAAVSSHDDKQRVRQWKDNNENSPLDSNSPLWMEIRLVGGDGKPANDIPLKDRYFEVALPKAFVEGTPKSITVNWIDFYRN